MMKHLKDIVIDKGYRKIIIFSNFTNSDYVSKHTKSYFYWQI
jgi:hypothetical protein